MESETQYSFPKTGLMIPNMQWYVEDNGGNSQKGQWYLALRDTEKGLTWVWQPEQNGNNVFSVLFLEAKTKITGFPMAQVQSAYFNPTKDSGFGICMATTIDKKLVVSDLTIPSSPQFFNGTKKPTPWIPADPRFFILGYEADKNRKSGSPIELNTSLVVESAMYKDYFLGINWQGMEGKGEKSYAPAVLILVTNPPFVDSEDFGLVRLPNDHIGAKRLVIDA